MANLTFLRYDVQDTGIELEFVNFVPGPGLPTNYTILITDAEVAGISTLAQLRTLVTTKLRRKLQAEGIATKLDPLIGLSVTI